MKDNIAIIGFMGSGKTTVGKILAARMDWNFFDLDRIIELSEGRTINDIFNDDGERYFRDVETKIILKTISDNKDCIFACGGGAVLRKENMYAVKKKCCIVYLAVSAEEAAARLTGSNERPLVDHGDRKRKIEELLVKRLPVYEKYAEITIDSEGADPGETAGKIIDIIKEKDLLPQI